jgi:uncharacterized protein (TIGR00369 family)
MVMIDLPDLNTGLDALLGTQIEELSPDRCLIRLDIDERHHQPFGIVHGGTYATIIETAASTAGSLWAMANGMRGAVGVSNTTDFYRPHREGAIIADATPVHRGRSQQVWQIEITCEADGKLLSRGQVRLHNLHDLQALEAPGNSTPDA